MLAYAKIALATLAILGLLTLGWKANGWRIRAAEASLARAELRHEQERRVKSDADRLALQVKLSEAEAKIGTGVKVVTSTIREYIHDTAPCRISAPVSVSLRALRAGEFPVPTAAPDAATARAAP